MPALDADIARQAPDPAGAKPAPKSEPEKDEEASQKDQHLSDFGHFRNVAPKPGQINLTGQLTAAEALYSGRRGGVMDEVDLREVVLKSTAIAEPLDAISSGKPSPFRSRNTKSKTNSLPMETVFGGWK